jgi:predicted nucleic acid-binding protein
LFIRGRFSDDALKLQRKDSVWRTEPFALVEFSNVFATYQRARYLSKAAALERLQLAEDFLSLNYLRVSNQSALELALQYRVSAYDARFLAVAIASIEADHRSSATPLRSAIVKGARFAAIKQANAVIRPF